MDVHVMARRIGNSWGIIIPKAVAGRLGIDERTRLHVDMRVLPELKELKGTFKTRKSIATLMQEIDAGWD